MANRLKMDIQKAIQGLKDQGWSERRISRELGIHRKTVKSYIEPSKCTKVLTGDEPETRSLCDRYHSTIEGKLELGLDARRIHQDLIIEHGFTGAYDSVQRYIKKLKKETPGRVWRMECEPAQEAQIDFGVMNLLDQGSGRLKRVNLFRITLSYSRKSYSEAVKNQSC